MCMRFYLGTHILNHMEKTDVPLFISINRLKRRKKKEFKQLGRIAIDSGGFTELGMHGKWTSTADEYVEELQRLMDLGLKIDWASPQDWMCEDVMLKKTGLSVLQHQWRTVENFMKLRELTNEIEGLHIIPVLQGQTLKDYFRHFEMYEVQGVNLRGEMLVGVGSVCRRESTEEIGTIMKGLGTKGLRLHGFGVKTGGIKKYGEWLVSADSMAWSRNARFDKKRCTSCINRPNPPKACNNCLDYALDWRGNIVKKP